MTLGDLLSIYKNGYYILSNGKHLLDINDKKYMLCTVKQKYQNKFQKSNKKYFFLWF